MAISLFRWMIGSGDGQQFVSGLVGASTRHSGGGLRTYRRH
ncbi:MAG: hypothetical protein VYB11_00455 [Gemmatimonadota bacterium]|nr:hypothetical protein [Gemmatimonadota bacterium]